MNRKNPAVILTFFAVLAAGTLASILKPHEEYSTSENRVLAEHPQLSAEEIFHGSYQEDYETWLNDQFPLRDCFVSLSSHSQRLFGKKDINGVYLGRDGYLIEKPDETTFDSLQLEDNIRFLSQFLNHAADTYGKERVCCMMVPSKAVVLTDRLPLFAASADFPSLCGGNPKSAQEDSISEQIKKALTEPDLLLDVTNCLLAHQSEYIYYRTDHHWTTLGAYYAYAAWANKTAHTPRPLSAYQKEDIYEDFYGTTYNKVRIRTAPDTVTLFHTPEERRIRIRRNDSSGTRKYDSLYVPAEATDSPARGSSSRYDVFLGGNTGKIIIDTGTKTDRTLLVIKDSFANCFVPFLTGDYRQILLIDYRYTKKTITDITAEHDEITDILVLFNTDKFCRDTGLKPLAGEIRSETMEEFDAEEFFK